MATERQPAWWRNAVIYEVYPRSFADGNADGRGRPARARRAGSRTWPSSGSTRSGSRRGTPHRWPTAGTTSRLPRHPPDVRRPWRTPRRSSPRPTGSASGSSSTWSPTTPAASTPGSPRRWPGGPVRPSAPATSSGTAMDRRASQPPNNWISAFGGPAWTRVREPDGSAGQWYLHTFAPEQPDVDWSSPEVRRGVRRDPAVLARPRRRRVPDRRGPGDGQAGRPAGRRLRPRQVRWEPADWVGQPALGHRRGARHLPPVAAGPRRVPGRPPLRGRGPVNGPERLARYVRPDELHAAFNFDVPARRVGRRGLREVVDATLASLAPTGAPATWVLSSHDEVRLLTRLGRTHGLGPSLTVDLGNRRARAAVLLILALPGGVYVYQGDELGLPEVEDLPDEVLAGPGLRADRGPRPRPRRLPGPPALVAGPAAVRLHDRRRRRRGSRSPRRGRA